MNFKIFPFFFLAFSVLSCSEKSETASDFDIVCEIFTQVEKQAPEDKVSPAERNAIILKRMEKSLPKESNAVVAWKAIQAAEPEFRYTLFEEAANASGIENWQCEPMKRLAPLTGIFE